MSGGLASIDSLILNVHASLAPQFQCTVAKSQRVKGLSQSDQLFTRLTLEVLKLSVVVTVAIVVFLCSGRLQGKHDLGWSLDTYVCLPAELLEIWDVKQIGLVPPKDQRPATPNESAKELSLVTCKKAASLWSFLSVLSSRACYCETKFLFPFVKVSLWVFGLCSFKCQLVLISVNASPLFKLIHSLPRDSNPFFVGSNQWRVLLAPTSPVRTP